METASMYPLSAIETEQNDYKLVPASAQSVVSGRADGEPYTKHRVKQFCGFVVSVHQRPCTAALCFHNGPADVVFKLADCIIFRRC